MGIYYDAYFGVGYKLKGMRGYDALESLGCRLHRANEDRFCLFSIHDYDEGDKGHIYLVAQETFAAENILTLDFVKKEMDAILLELGVEAEGEFGICGGLCAI